MKRPSKLKVVGILVGIATFVVLVVYWISQWDWT